MRPVYRTRRRGPSGLAIGLALTVLVVGGGLGFYLGYWRNRETGSHAPNAGGVHIPASDALPHTWGYVGCSDTHDTVAGYHLVSSKHLFWPFRGYEIGGKAVPE